MTTYLSELPTDGEYVVNITDPNGAFFTAAPTQ